MSRRLPAVHPFRWGVGIAVAIGLAYATTFARRHVLSAPSQLQSDSKRSDSGTLVSAAEKRDRRFEIVVPKSSPTSFVSPREETVRQGDVIEFAVTSPRPGAVVVHGFFDPQPIPTSGRVTVAFRAIYSGRFALHFHGNDGSHFELMALNVLPAGIADH